MFCPDCGNLGTIDDGKIRCSNPKCFFLGAKAKAKKDLEGDARDEAIAEIEEYWGGLSRDDRRIMHPAYEGPLDGKAAIFKDEMTGEEVDLTKMTVSGSEKSLKHLEEVVPEEVARGTLRVGDIRCPECDLNEIYVVLMQTRSSDEPETKICTCKNCGKKFREYQ